MVIIRKKSKRNKEYYYLEHSLRSGKTIVKKERYLGTVIPQNLEEIKAHFLEEIYAEKWHVLLEQIRRAFSRERKLMPKIIRDKELRSFIVKFTYDTQRIEGSTLTLRETANLIERGITPKEKPLRDVKEAEAHRDLMYELLNTTKELSLQMVLSWHKRLFSQTKPEIAGKVRTYGVAISGSKFMPPIPVELESLLRDFFDWYHQQKKNIPPVELAALAHLKLVTIHPFGDGNGRISRLLMNYILHKYGYPLLDIAYDNRHSYYRALERSQITGKEIIFVQWFIKRYVREYQLYVKKSRHAPR